MLTKYNWSLNELHLWKTKFVWKKKKKKLSKIYCFAIRTSKWTETCPFHEIFISILWSHAKWRNRHFVSWNESRTITRYGCDVHCFSLWFQRVRIRTKKNNSIRNTSIRYNNTHWIKGKPRGQNNFSRFFFSNFLWSLLLSFFFFFNEQRNGNILFYRALVIIPTLKFLFTPTAHGHR